MRLERYLTEVFETVPNVDIKWGTSSSTTTTLLDKDSVIYVKFVSYDPKKYRVEFSVNNRGTASATEIFNAAMLTIKEFIKKFKPIELAFLPFDMRRSHIYKKMIGKFIDKAKWYVDEIPAPFVKNAKAYMISRK